MKMFDKCIKCVKIGESCVPNLLLLPFAELLKWIDKRQKHLSWTTKVLAEKSKIPEGTIYRIKAGEEDCKFATMRNILIALIGGTTDEFACTEQVEKELKHMEALASQAAKLSSVEAENEILKKRLNEIDELHRNDIRIVKEEYREQIAFLKDQLKAWQSRG
jgi:hypothetical protein